MTMMTSTFNMTRAMVLMLVWSSTFVITPIELAQTRFKTTPALWIRMEPALT